MPPKSPLPPFVSIKNALFKKSNLKGVAHVFKNPINFEIKNRLPQDRVQKWCVWGPRKAEFLNVLSRKEYLTVPDSSAVQYHKLGSLANTNEDFKVEFMKFKPPPTSPHLSARFEHFKSEFDEKLSTFVKNTGYTSTLVDYELVNSTREIDTDLYEQLMHRLDLKPLEERLVIGLSNGQLRRSRLARSLLTQADLLIIDDLYLGLDPVSRNLISDTINWFNTEYRDHSMAIVGLRTQDKIPDWCSDVVIVEENGVSYQGPITPDIIESYKTKWDTLNREKELAIEKLSTGNAPFGKKIGIADLVAHHEWYNVDHAQTHPHHFKLNGVSVSYRGTPVLQNVNWDVLKKSMWHVQGNNGSGKSTLISLLTADHPQSWNSKIINEYNKPRKTGSSNYFDINKSIATSSPEIHSIALKFHSLTLQDLVLSGLNDDSSNNFTARKNQITESRLKLCDEFLQYFNLSHLKETKFRELSVNDQKLGLFVRCLVKLPKLLILDESFSGMELSTIEKCHHFLEQWPGTVLLIAHLPEEIPSSCKSSIKLIKPGHYEIKQ